MDENSEMMEMMVIAVCAFVSGCLIGMLYFLFKRQSYMSKIEVLQSRLDGAVKQTEEVKSDYASRMDAVRKESEMRLAEVREEAERHCRRSMDEKDAACMEKLEAQEKRHDEAMAALQTRFDETVQKVTAQVKSATEDMLKQRQKEFSESSSTNIGQIVNPLRETIDKMKKAMDDSALSQTRMSTEMKAAAENMMRQSEAARKSADDLARAFRHGTKIQGDWGETVLTELLESQGLTPGIHFDVQSSIRDASGNVVRSESGNIMRPDIILHLDMKREVIVDSKVSLTAFMDYVNADDEEDRKRFLKAHVESLEKHVKELSAKDYSSYIRPPKVRMDYVIMFVPHSGALWTALNVSPDLWRRAMEKNVFIADEQTLFAALRIINLTWTQIAQAQNHEKVFALANEMLDRVGQFMKKFEAVGKSLDAAQKSYEEAGKKLSPSGQSILQTCAKLERLGARQSDRNPIPQLAEADGISAAGTSEETPVAIN